MCRIYAIDRDWIVCTEYSHNILHPNSILCMVLSEIQRLSVIQRVCITNAFLLFKFVPHVFFSAHLFPLSVMALGTRY
jgi:hypothetical protein